MSRYQVQHIDVLNHRLIVVHYLMACHDVLADREDGYVSIGLSTPQLTDSEYAIALHQYNKSTHCICICFDGMVIAAQCTVTF